MWTDPQATAHLVTFTEEMLNEKLIYCERETIVN